MTLPSQCFYVSACRFISVLNIICPFFEQITTNAYKCGEEVNIFQTFVWQFIAEQTGQEGETASRTDIKRFQKQHSGRNRHDVLSFVYSRDDLRHSCSKLEADGQQCQPGDLVMQGRMERRFQIVMSFGDMVWSAALSRTELNFFWSSCQRFVQVTSRGRSSRPSSPFESNVFSVIKLQLVVRGGVIQHGVSLCAEETVQHALNERVPSGMGQIHSVGFLATEEDEHTGLLKDLHIGSAAGYVTTSCKEGEDFLDVLSDADVNFAGAIGGAHHSVTDGHDRHACTEDIERLATIHGDKHLRNLELAGMAAQRGEPNHHACTANIERRAGIQKDIHRRNLELARSAPQRGALDETLQARFFKSLGVHPLYPVSSCPSCIEGVGLDAAGGARKNKRQKRQAERCGWNPDFVFRDRTNILTPGFCHPEIQAV
jgi:hypothetical protein